MRSNSLMGSAHLLVVPASFFWGASFVALGLGVNLGVTQAAGINQPGGWVHEKGHQGQNWGKEYCKNIAREHWGGRSPIVKIKGLAIFFLDGVRTGDASGQNGDLSAGSRVHGECQNGDVKRMVIHDLCILKRVAS